MLPPPPPPSLRKPVASPLLLQHTHGGSMLMQLYRHAQNMLKTLNTLIT